MKQLLTITGAPTTTSMVAKDFTFQLGKIAVLWFGSFIVSKVVVSAIAAKRPGIH